MKKLIIIPLLLLSLICYSATYYVAKTGSDSYTKTQAKNIGTPWLTISHAESQMVGGDTCFVRTGTYNEMVYVDISAGTALDPTVIMAYPGELPVVDGTGESLSEGSYLVQIESTYFNIYGFEVRDSEEGGICLTSSATHSIISHCEVHECIQNGISALADYTVVEYCEVYNCAMSNSDGIWQPGEVWGGGITARGNSSVQISYPVLRYNVCHDVWGEGIDFCFVDNGTFEDNIIYDTYSVSLYLRNTQNSIVQRNLVYMTKVVGDIGGGGVGHWNEGDASFKNDNNTFINNIVSGGSRNFYSEDVTTDLLVANNTFINSTYLFNVQLNSYSGTTNFDFQNNVIIQENSDECIYHYIASGDGSGITFSNNLYNKAYDSDAVGADDEISVAHISKVGTIADTSYYKLVSASPGVNGGIALAKVTNDYLDSLRADPPEIGALEYYPPDPPLDPQLADVETYRPKWASATTATTGGQVIDDGGDAVTVRGVCWNTTGTPTTADSKTEDGSGTGAFTSTMTGLTKGLTYYVRAYATNAVGTAYGTEMTFRRVFFFHGGKILTHGGKPLFID